MGEYYFEWDLDMQMYCVFHTEQGNFAFGTFSDAEEAAEYARTLNTESNSSNV